MFNHTLKVTPRTLVGGALIFGFALLCASLANAADEPKEKNNVSAKMAKPLKAAQDDLTAKKYADAIGKLKGNSNPFRALAETGKQAYEYHEVNKTRLSSAIGTSEWITESLQRTADTVVSRMQSGLPVLASVGATAPFVGLLGTVIGIYHALIAIGVAGQASIDKVAGPVGEALIMTAIGLAVAVPAVLGYNILLRRNKGVQERVSHFTHELHAYLISGAKMGLGMDKGPAPIAKTAPAAAR